MRSGFFRKYLRSVFLPSPSQPQKCREEPAPAGRSGRSAHGGQSRPCDAGRSLELEAEQPPKPRRLRGCRRHGAGWAYGRGHSSSALGACSGFWPSLPPFGYNRCCGRLGAVI